jgi:pantetheine-phosphate adenylyltransferase
MTVAACYPGSFDPPTFGHLDVVRRVLPLFDRIVMAVGVNAAKASVFTPEERVEMLRAQVRDLGGQVEVASFRGLAVEFCRSQGIRVMVRGLRTVSDFETEFQMALTNRNFAPEIETVFVMPGEKYSYVSSRLIKEVVQAGGPVDAFVPPAVARALEKRLRPRA